MVASEVCDQGYRPGHDPLAEASGPIVTAVAALAVPELPPRENRLTGKISSWGRMVETDPSVCHFDHVHPPVADPNDKCVLPISRESAEDDPDLCALPQGWTSLQGCFGLGPSCMGIGHRLPDVQGWGDVVDLIFPDRWQRLGGAERLQAELPLRYPRRRMPA